MVWILDVDLDLFQSEVAKKHPEPDSLDGGTAEEVRSFFVDQLGLREPLPGAEVVHHDGVFWKWKRRVESGNLGIPFSVVHADAHADLGLTDGYAKSYVTIDKLLALPRAARSRSPLLRVDDDEWGEAVNPGNYLAFAIALGWIDQLVYAYHPKLRMWDLPCRRWVDGQAPPSNYPLGVEENFAMQMRDGEPVVGVTCVPYDQYCWNRTDEFDSMYLAVSPDYVVPETEDLLDLIREFIVSPSTS